jgi:hypothetical protein
VQAVRMRRIDRERLLAADLSVQMPPGAQMRKAGLIKCGRRACRRRLQVCPGGFGGGPAFAAIHQRISTWLEFQPIDDSAMRRKPSTSCPAVRAGAAPWRRCVERPSRLLHCDNSPAVRIGLLPSGDVS